MSRSRSRSRSAMSMSRSRSPVKRNRSVSPPPRGDSNCPFHVRMYVGKSHAPMKDYDQGRFPVETEFVVYGWKHSTPTSLIALLYPSFPAPFRSPQARFSFKHIYVDATPTSLYRARDLTTFSGRDLMQSLVSSNKEQKASMDMELDDTPDAPVTRGKKVSERTLKGYGYEIGDIISVSVHVPEPKVPRPAPGAGVGAGDGKPSFGWGERGDRREERGDGGWGGKGALPPQDSRRGGFGGGRDRDEPAGGGSWRGGHAGRGGRGRSRSPPPRERNARERSPVRGRRESWSRR